jgi:cysteine desulfurase/selenocysteine lyase
MNKTTRRVYLDHAATSWPKSGAVLDAMDEFARNCGAAAGRGGYRSAAIADRVVATTRKSIANLIHAESSDCISLHSNGTSALNSAIHGILRSGDHVVTSAAEHNSVLRPLHQLESAGIISLTVVPTDNQGAVDANQVLESVGPKTRLVTLTHASNVTGCVEPIGEVGSGLRESPAFFLCDAAQTFGALPIDVQGSGIDLLAAPGHKASGGPLGTGFLYVSPSTHAELLPTIQGGTGSQSESLEMPTAMPSKLEAGNLNVPALAGWNAALQQMSTTELKTRIRVMSNIADQLFDGLAQIDGIRLFGRSRSLPIASIAVEGYSVTDVAIILDSEFGIETRAGMHCAALIHRFLDSETEGTLRISAGHNTTDSDINAVIAAIGDISGNQTTG